MENNNLPRPNAEPPRSPSDYDAFPVHEEAPAPKPKKKTGWLKGAVMVVVFVALAFAFSRLIPGSDPAPEQPTDPPGNWEKNVLMAAPEGIEEMSAEELCQVPLLPGIGWERQTIRSVTFLSKEPLTGAVADISVDGDGSVVSWAVPNGDLYDVYIAGDGGINAADACPYMFAGCTNLIRVDFGDGFHTDHATDMSLMFWGCFSLTELDLSSFNTENVADMEFMFSGCSSLTELNLSSFNTEQVTDMGGMFESCYSLTELDLSNFNTERVISMMEMFWGCPGVTVDDVAHFDTSSVTDYAYFMDGTGWEYLFE